MSKDFGSFLTKLANTATTASPDLLEKVKAKLEAENQQRIENRLRDVFTRIERQVTIIRTLRRQETEAKDAIKLLEKEAQRIIEGKDQ